MQLKSSDIHTIGIQDGKEGKQKQYLKRCWPRVIQQWWKIYSHIFRRLCQNLNKIDTLKATMRDIIIRLMKTKDPEKIVHQPGGKCRTHYFQRSHRRYTTDFSTEITLEYKGIPTLKFLREHTVNLNFISSKKYCSKVNVN